MVTTRSADKRLEASKEDELVLRSRKLGSPRSTASTPSRTSKRTLNQAEDNDKPHHKRARFETSENKYPAPIVINVPPRIINHERNSPSQTDSLSSQATPRSSVMLNMDDDQATPITGTSKSLDTPDRGEMFRTPATSRHIRFDSVEVDDDTTVVNANADSATTQGYQTAEEEIADSDDEAPKVETTKVASNLPLRKSTRTPKAKNATARTFAGRSVTRDTVEADSVGIEAANLDLSRVADETLVDDSRPDNEPAVTNEISSQALQVPSSQSQVALQTAITTSEFPTDTKIATSPTHDHSLSLRDTDVVTVAEYQDPSNLDTPSRSYQKNDLSNPSTHLRHLPSLDISDQHGEDHLDHNFRRPLSIQAGNIDIVAPTRPFRLPAKTMSNLSSYRRDRLQCRVGTSAGAFKTQVDWSKKRGSFVVS